MANENRLTQAALQALTESTGANARLSQAELLALTENINAKARITQLALMVLTDPTPPVITPVSYTLPNTDHDAYGILEWTDPDGAWVNSSSLNGRDYFTSAQITNTLDSNTMQFSAVLARETDGVSLSPLIEGSVLNVRTSTGTYAPLIDVKRFWRLSVAIMAKGVAPSPSDYHLIGTGIIDSVDWGQDSQITIVGRDLNAIILDSFILDLTPTVLPRRFSLANDQFMEAVIQQELDAQLGTGAVVLNVPVPTSFIIKAFQQDYESLNSAVTKLADLAGFMLRYRLNYPNLGDFNYTLWLPNRSPVAIDWEIGPTAYTVLPINKIDVTGVRNYIVVKFIDGTTGQLTNATSPAPLSGTITAVNGAATFSVSQAGVIADGSLIVVDGVGYQVSGFDGTVNCTLSGLANFTAAEWTTSASLTQYGLRPMLIEQRNGSQINDITHAQLMADAARSDIEFPLLEQQFEAFGLWFVQLGDYVKLDANNVHYDNPQFGGVTSYTHLLSNGLLKTTVGLRGKPAARYRTWLAYGAASTVFTSPDLNVSVVNGLDSYVITWSGVGVMVSIDGATPVAPGASPWTIVRDLTDHLYQFTGADGTMFPVVIPAAFSVGPEISYTTDDTGALTVYIDGKPEADRTYIAVRTDRRPTVQEILPPSEGGIATIYGEVGPGTRTGNVKGIAILDVVSGVETSVSNLVPGKKFFIGAVSLNLSNTPSSPSYVEEPYLGTNVTPAATFAFGTYTITDRLVTFANLAISDAVQRIEFFVAETNSDPSPGSTTPPSVEASVPEVEDWIERRADGTIDTIITFPLMAASDYLSITAVVIDHLHRRGATVTIKVQALSSTPSAPGAITLSDPPTSITSTNMGFGLTWPGGSPAPDALRLFIDGVQQPDFAFTAGSPPSGTIIVGSPGQTISLVAQAVVSATGAVSANSNIVTATFAADTSGGGAGTGSNGKLISPTAIAAQWDDTSKIMLIYFTTSGSDPVGTTYNLYRALSSAGPFTEVSSGNASTLIGWDGETQNKFHTQNIYYKVSASCPGYTDSDLSAYIIGAIPMGWP